MSKIEWTDKTWNPIAGCSKVSEGCRNCYAETMAKRLVAMGQSKYQGTIDGYVQQHWSGVVKLDEKTLQLPYKTKKPTRFFVNSMSDLFHENVPDEWIRGIFRVMDQANWHTYQVLTKRPERMRDILNSANWWGGRFAEQMKHIWLGVSVENQEAANERIPYLLGIKDVSVRFLSCEPLLGPVNLTRLCVPNCPDAFIDSLQGLVHGPDDKLPNINWVITGGESGPNARPMHPDWVRSLRDQCNAAGVPFFLKQWGEWGEDCPDGYHNSKSCIIRPNGTTYLADCADNSADKWLFKVGKQRAGRVLDGRTWDEAPRGCHG